MQSWGRRPSRSLLLVVLGFAIACQQRSGMSDTVVIHYLPSLTPHDDATIEEAAGLLSMEIIVDHDEPTDGVVVIVDIGDGIIDGMVGLTEWYGDDAPCGALVWVNESPYALAHELGHALGLEHVDDPNNLMYPRVGVRDEVTDEQIDRMRHTAWYLHNRCD